MLLLASTAHLGYECMDGWMDIGEVDRLWNWPFTQLLDHRHLDLGSSHTAYRRVTLINLYLHTKFRSNCKNFVDGRTQVCMHVRMDGQTDTETSFSRLTPSWPKSVSALAQIVTAQFFSLVSTFLFYCLILVFIMVNNGLCSVLRPRQHSTGYMGDGFYRSKDPTNSIKVLKENNPKTKKTQITHVHTHTK